MNGLKAILRIAYSNLKKQGRCWKFGTVFLGCSYGRPLGGGNGGTRHTLYVNISGFWGLLELGVTFRLLCRSKNFALPPWSTKGCDFTYFSATFHFLGRCKLKENCLLKGEIKFQKKLRTYADTVKYVLESCTITVEDKTFLWTRMLVKICNISPVFDSLHFDIATEDRIHNLVEHVWVFNLRLN